MASNLLITGSAKGLGKHLHTKLGGLGLTRENSADILKNQHAFSSIVHCAFSDPLDQVKTENITLTESLLNLKTNKFIFISSADVYSLHDKLHSEDDLLSETVFRSEYAKQKALCEQLVLKAHPSAVIIRPVTILSESLKSRNLLRLLNDAEPSLSLTEDSTLNFVTSSEIASFIDVCLKKNLSGTFNMARTEAVLLRDLAKLVRKKVTFGDFKYNVGQISNKKILTHLPSLNESSLTFFKKWLSENNYL